MQLSPQKCLGSMTPCAKYHTINALRNAEETVVYDRTAVRKYDSHGPTQHGRSKYGANQRGLGAILRCSVEVWKDPVRFMRAVWKVLWVLVVTLSLVSCVFSLG